MGKETFPRDQFRGPKGDRGPQGPRGPAGADGGGGGGGSGSTWYDGAGAPSSGLGVDGDYYLRTSNGDVYHKASGAWSVTGNIKGADGADGAPGADGADGADGAAGAAGAAGAPGSVWRDGAGVPSNALGINGDYYLRDSNGDVYLRTAGVYAVVANIKGAAGAAGAAGADGAGFLGGPAPAFPALTPAIYERWIFDVPNITLVDGRVSLVTGVVNGRTWAQATAANRPRFYPRRFNGGFGSVFFNGTSHRMVHVAAATKAVPFSMVVVMEDYLGGTGNQNLINTGTIIWFRSGGNWVAYAGTVAQHTTSGALAVTAPLLDGGTNHPVAGIEVFNGAATVVNAYGTEQTINSGAAANALTNAGNVFLCDDGAGTGWARAKIREIIFAEGAIPIGERAALLTYYSHPLIAGIPSPI